MQLFLSYAHKRSIQHSDIEVCPFNVIWLSYRELLRVAVVAPTVREGVLTREHVGPRLVGRTNTRRLNSFDG